MIECNDDFWLDYTVKKEERKEERKERMWKKKKEKVGKYFIYVC